MVIKSISPASQLALTVGFFLTLISGMVAGLGIQISQPQLPLLYTQAQPTATLVNHNWLLIIPALSLILELTNLVTVVWLKSLPNLILGFFSWVLTISQLLLLLALLRILWITL